MYWLLITLDVSYSHVVSAHFLILVYHHNKHMSNLGDL